MTRRFKAEEREERYGAEAEEVVRSGIPIPRARHEATEKVSAIANTTFYAVFTSPNGALIRVGSTLIMQVIFTTLNRGALGL